MRVHREVLTISDYLHLMGMRTKPVPRTLEELRTTVDQMQDLIGETIWDYPLEEIEMIDSPVALVTDGKEYRWYEILMED